MKLLPASLYIVMLNNMVPLHALHSAPSSPAGPRHLDPAKAFEALAGWLARFIEEKNIPGAIVGISGTDSILAFLICTKAFEKAGKQDRVIGIHYGAPFPPVDKSEEELKRILDINPGYRWVARSVVPWLQAQAPQAKVIVDSSIDHNDDYQRWAALFRSSLNGASRTEPLPEGSNYWVVGTRNATEDALGAYSNISGAVSLQPLLGLWKSEILKICSALGVPPAALEKSRQVDCDCGRFDIAANHIDEVDAVLMTRSGLLPRGWIEKNIASELLAQLEKFVDEQIAYAKFKKDIPYKPPADILA